jgi:hypothetical protein
MTPGQITNGVCIVVAFIGGALTGRNAVHVDWAAEREQQARAQSEYIARNFVSRSIAEAQYQALAGRSAKVLREVIHVPAEPLQCPNGTDVRDVLIPGLADRLRKLRDATDVDPATPLGAVQF